MNGLMHRSKLCLFDHVIGADLLRRLSSIFWIEIGSYVDSLRSCPLYDWNLSLNQLRRMGAAV